MKRRRSAIAIALCAALFASACAAVNDKKSDTDSTVKAQDAVEAKTAEKEYQGSLDLIYPRAYSETAGLNLEPGSYISVIGKGDSGQFWDAVKEGANQAADDLNEELGYKGKDKIKVTYSGPSEADNVDEQVNILDEELARYPVALGIAIADAKACEVQFDLAAESDIPVVAFDSGSDYQGLMATVATDNETTARAAADKLAEAMGHTGKIVIFAHDSKSKSATQRENAFKDQMAAQHPGITIADIYHMDQLAEIQKRIVEEVNAGTYQKEGMEVQPDQEEISTDSITKEDVLEYLFTKNADIKGCYATNSDAVKLALTGIERAKLQDVSVIAYDADEEELEALEDERIDGLIVQNPFGMGYATVIAAARSALKMPNEAYIDTGYTWVTKKNMGEEAVQKILY